jgi:ribulose-5-phosphate 4-epimerase/fuculose-1-phosphate aldolase
MFISATDHTRVDPTGHRTCVASKATGWSLGAAKLSDLVIVKVEVVNGRVVGIMRGLS